MYYSNHTALLTTIAIASLASAQFYSAELFSPGGMIGKTVHVTGAQDTCEWRYWIGLDPDCETIAIDTRARLLPWSAIIDGSQINAVFIQLGEVLGAPSFGGSPIILSDTEGFINFGHHPMRPSDREHFISGITEIPGSFELNQCFAEPRADSWEGCWEGEPPLCWSGSVDRTICVRDFEDINHPTLGVVRALRIDSTDERTKVALDESQWATEEWEFSLWAVEGEGFVRFERSEIKEFFEPGFADGRDPFYRSESVEVWDLTLYCLTDIDFNGLLDLADITAFLESFSTGEPIADLNADGLLDLGDVVAFVEAFTTGC